MRAHGATVLRPPPNAAPRSIVAKMTSYRIKEEIIKIAYQKHGFEYMGNKVNLHHDYVPEVLKQQKEYSELPTRMWIFYPEGLALYSSAEEATGDLSKRGCPVTVIKSPETILEQIRQRAWESDN